MSRGDEVWATAHNVLHAALGLHGVRDKDCSVQPSDPIVRRPCVDLEEKHELRGDMMITDSASWPHAIDGEDRNQRRTLPYAM